MSAARNFGLVFTERTQDSITILNKGEVSRCRESSVPRGVPPHQPGRNNNGWEILRDPVFFPRSYITQLGGRANFFPSPHDRKLTPNPPEKRETGGESCKFNCRPLHLSGGSLRTPLHPRLQQRPQEDVRDPQARGEDSPVLQRFAQVKYGTWSREVMLKLRS